MAEHRDDHFMKEALREANLAFAAGEVPIGAVLVYKGEIIARAFNRVEKERDPTAHAELQTLRTGAAFLSDWRLSGTALYTTLEPCLMCAGAILLARVTQLIWGAPGYRFGVNGSWVDLLGRGDVSPHLEIRKGVLQGESSALLRAFFQMQRKR